MKKLKIILLISGTGTNAIAIHKACLSGKINGEIVAVGSDNSEAKGLDYFRKKGIPDFLVDYETPKKVCKEFQDIGIFLPIDFDLKGVLAKEHIRPALEPIHKKMRYFQARAISEARLLAEMQKYPFDLVVLAGFMRIFTPYIIDRINLNGVHRIMNIHPALLPAFPGTDGYGDTFRYGCKVGGCTVHFVDYGEDTGPIIGQKVYSINSEDTLNDIRTRGLPFEWELYPECIQLFAENRLVVFEREGKKVVDILPKGQIDNEQ